MAKNKLEKSTKEIKQNIRKYLPIKKDDGKRGTEEQKSHEI